MRPTHSSAVVVAVAKEKTHEPTVCGQIDDAFITALIQLALVSHRSTSALKTHVETQDGIVTLTGAVSNHTEKDLVTKLVQDIRVVRTVRNNMTIDGTVPHPTPGSYKTYLLKA